MIQDSSKNWIITNAQNFEKASTLAFNMGGTVLSVESSTITESSNSTTASGDLVGSHDIWTMTFALTKIPEDQTYSDAGIEQAIVATGYFFTSSQVFPGRYVLSSTVHLSDEKSASTYIANSFRQAGHFVVILL